MLILTLILSGLTFVFMQFYYKIKEFRRVEKMLKRVPGPPPNILFGNALDFLNSKRRLAATKKYGEIYGRTIKLYYGPFTIALVTYDKNFIEFLLTSSNKLIDKSTEYRNFEDWLGTGLLTSRGTKWRIRRKVLTPSFHFSILNQLVDIVDPVVDVLIAKLDKQVDKDSVDIYPFLTLCMLDVVCESTMGTSVKAQETEHCEHLERVKTLCKICTDKAYFPLPPLLYRLNPAYYKEKKALKIYHSYTDSVINKKMKEYKLNSESGNTENEFGIKKRMAFLDTLLECRIDGKPLSKKDLREEVDTFMFAGHDTLTTASSFILYCIAIHPEVQERIVKEQTDIFGEDNKAKITPTHLQDMKYLELVIKETLRIYSPVPNIGRVFLEDVEYDGTIYPKGLNILIMISKCHRAAEYFCDPHKFIPERFEQKENIPLFSYLPFAAGSRNCIGHRFAMMVLKTTVSKVIRNFVLSPSKPKHKLQLISSMILESKNGVKVSLQRRIK